MGLDLELGGAVAAHDASEGAPPGGGLGLWGSVGLGIGTLQPLLSAQVFQLGLLYGGPATVVYGFITCFVLCVPLALSMSELAARHVHAGGIYAWAGLVSGRMGKMPAFVSGWVYTIAAVSGTAAVALQAVSLRLIATHGFGTPGTLGVQFAWAVVLIVTSSGVALAPPRAIDAFAKFSLLWLVFAAVLLVFALPALAVEPRSSAWVWRSDTLADSARAAGIDESVAGSATGAKAYTFLAGLLPAQFLMLFFDIPAFMSEETVDARRTVPRAMMITFVGGAAFSFALLLAFLYAITDVDSASVPGAGITGSCPLGPNGTPAVTAPGGCILSNELPFTYYVLGNIVYDVFAGRFPACAAATAVDAATNLCIPASGCCDVLGRVRPSAAATGAAGFFAALPLVGVIVACANTVVGSSRFVYAFARDGGYPSAVTPFLTAVSKATNAPAGAVIAMGAASLAFAACWTNKSPQVSFTAVTGIGANGVLMLFGLPCLLRATVGRKDFKPHPAFSLGRASVPCALLGSLAYAGFSNATIALPALFPATAATLNFAPVVLGAALALALALYGLACALPDATWCFVGPQPLGQAAKEADGQPIVRRATFAVRPKIGRQAARSMNFAAGPAENGDGLFGRLRRRNKPAYDFSAEPSLPLPPAAAGTFKESYDLGERLSAQEPPTSAAPQLKRGSPFIGGVFSATHSATERQCTLKILRLPPYSTGGGDGALLETVLAEVRVLAALTAAHCPAAPRLLAWFRDARPGEPAPAGPAAALPLLRIVCAAAVEEGGAARDVLEVFATLPGAYSEDDARDVMRQLLCGLAGAAAAGVTHRNIKLENLLLSGGDGEARGALTIVGWGLARAGGALDAADARLGTPLYAAPELVGAPGPSGAPPGSPGVVSPAADVWAAGVVAHVLLCGSPPFESKDDAQLFALIRAAELHLDDDAAWEAVSPAGRDLVAKLLTAAPDARLSATQALRHAWFSEQGGAATGLGAAQDRLRRERTRRRFRAAIGGAQAIGRLKRALLSAAAANDAAEAQAAAPSEAAAVDDAAPSDAGAADEETAAPAPRVSRGASLLELAARTERGDKDDA